VSLKHSFEMQTKPQRVVVVGSNGFVGASVMGRLAAAGIDALGISRKDIDLLADDAADQLMAALRPSDCVVLAAAIAPCKNAAMMLDNMILLRNLITSLSQVRPDHVINISSDAVFPDEPVPLSEATPLAPGSMHGAMHLTREIAFRSEVYAPLAIVRPTLLYGVRDPHNGYGPNRFRRCANQGQPIVLFGDGEERRDHVLIDDLAEVILRIILHRSIGALNVATGAVHSFFEIAQMVVAAAHANVEIKKTPRVGEMPHKGYRSFDVSACRAAFSDLPFVALQDGLVAVQSQETRD